MLNADVTFDVRDGSLDLGGVITGFGDITKEGEGTLRFVGPGRNTFLGDTFVNDGTLELGKVSGALGGAITVGDGVGSPEILRNLAQNQVGVITVTGLAQWDLNDFDDSSPLIVFDQGGDVHTGAGSLSMDPGASIQVIPHPLGANSSMLSGLLDLRNSTEFQVQEGPSPTNDSTELFISASIRGDGQVIKRGNGDLNLTASNAFTGAVRVEAGELRVRHPLALGADTAGVNVSGTATLNLFNNINVLREPLTLNSIENGDLGALHNGAGSNTWSGPITLSTETHINVETNSSLTLRGVINGAGNVTKGGPGTLTFSGTQANTYIGTTTVNQGELVLTKSGGQHAIPGALIIGDGVGGSAADVVRATGGNQITNQARVTVNESGFFFTTGQIGGSLAGTGLVELPGQTSILQVGADNTSSEFDGSIRGGGGLRKIGTGTLTLNGDNTYDSFTAVVEGHLRINGQVRNSQVNVKTNALVSGQGSVEFLIAEPGGTVAPGSSVGTLFSKELILQRDSIYAVELSGPYGQNDQMKVSGPVGIEEARLNVSLGYVPAEGEEHIIIRNDDVDPVLGTFRGLPEGATLTTNGVQLVVSYKGGSGNDVTLTATNLPLAAVGATALGGNGNGVIEPNECNLLLLALTNRFGQPVTGISAILDSITPGVVVTAARSAYPDIGPSSSATNLTAFQLRTLPTFTCGENIDLRLTVDTANRGSMPVRFILPTGDSSAGSLSGFGSQDLPIPDTRSVTSSIVVTNFSGPLAKAIVSVYAEHPTAGDLEFVLEAPDSTTVLLSSRHGGAGDNYGTACSVPDNVTAFDDDAPVRITDGSAPFVGSFAPEQPLARLIGKSGNGTWRLHVRDLNAGNTGTLRCWQLKLLRPACSPGGGGCESCVATIAGSLSTNGPAMSQRLSGGEALPSGCATANVCSSPTTDELGRPFHYNTHAFTNAGPATCVSVVLRAPCAVKGSLLYASAYLNQFDPVNLCANYLGELGDIEGTKTNSFSFPLPAGARFVIVVNETEHVEEADSDIACPDYSLELFGLPCPPPQLHIAPAAQPDKVRVFWSTSAAGFQLESAPDVNGAGEFTPFPTPPVVVSGQFTVTNNVSTQREFYRLSKP